MRRALRFPALVLAVALVGSSVAKSPPPSAAKASPPPPRLAVVIAVDGLSWSRLVGWRAWYTSGLKRLLDTGAVATECRYGHLNTETGPGHASIATGAPPRVHGIPLNQWYAPSADGSKMETVYSADSSRGKLGPGNLEAATLGDRLVAKDPRAKVVSISIKDRAAIFMAGRSPRHAAYWYTSKDGTFTTSAAYDTSSPVGFAAARVVERFNAARAGAQLQARYGATWSRIPVPEPAPEPGFESGFDAYQDAIAGYGFPKDLTKAKKPYATTLLWTAISDRLLADLAIDLIADDTLALGRDDVPDLLWISFSANDYVSHYYGPESVEDLELLRGLDVQLGRLLDELTRRFGRDALTVALSADHGFLPLPEAPRRGDPTSKETRVPDVAIVKELNRAVDTELLLGSAASPVYRLEGCSLWLDRVLLAKPGAPSIDRVLGVVRRELGTTWKDAIERTIVVDAPFPEIGTDQALLRAWNGRVPGRCGDLFVISRPGVLIDPYEGKGSSHGTPWEYDTHVPLIFWGGGIAAQTLVEPSTPYDLAPTLAVWLGVDLPQATGTRINVRGTQAAKTR